MEEVEVHRGRGTVECELLSAALRDAAVPFLVKSPNGIAEYPFTVGPMAHFQILVARDNAETARDILNGLQLPHTGEDPVGSNLDERRFSSHARRTVSRSQFWISLAWLCAFVGAGFMVSAGDSRPVAISGALLVLLGLVAIVVLRTRL